MAESLSRLGPVSVPGSVRNLSVYSSGVVLETELQVGDAYVSVQACPGLVSQKCSPARPLLTA
jgi:hypothetical protein